MLPPRPAGPARCDYNPRMSATGRAPRARLALCLLLAAPLAAQAPPVAAGAPGAGADRRRHAGDDRRPRGRRPRRCPGRPSRWRGAIRAWSPRRPPSVSTRARGMGMRGTLVGEFPSGGGTSGSFKGTVTRLAGAGRGVRQGPALRADPERESAGRQSLGMAHAPEGTTLMMPMRTDTRPSHSRPPRPPSPSAWPSRTAAPPPARRRRRGAPPVFTAAQAAAGRDVYQARCAGCHLRRPGRPQRRAAAGRRHLLRASGARGPTRELAEYIRASMPPGGPPLAADEAVAVTAFILASNGAAAGATALTADAAVPVGSVATGVATAARQPRLAPAADRSSRLPAVGLHRAAAASAHRRPAAPRPLRGRRGAALHAGHRRDAAHAAARRLADGAAHLPGVEPQPARPRSPRPTSARCGWPGRGT